MMFPELGEVWQGIIVVEYHLEVAVTVASNISLRPTASSLILSRGTISTKKSNMSVRVMAAAMSFSGEPGVCSPPRGAKSGW
ncbi:hypothetical protein ACFX2I_042860 [Malus domestica]